MDQNNINLTTKFSVIIAVYNGEKTINKAIESVLSQTFPAFELIVVDDGSTDGTKAQLKQFEDKIIYIHQENAGVSVARNKGVEKARGEWICFLDADDWYYPDRLKWHAELIEQHPELDFMTGNFDYVDEQGHIIRQSMQSTKAGLTLLDKANNKPTTIMHGNVINDFIEQHFGDTHTLSLKRKTFLQLDGYPQGIAVCEDVYFLIQLCALSKKIGVVTTPMAAYMIHSNSATRSDPLRAQQQTLTSLNRLKKHIKSVNPPLFKGLMRAIRHARLDLAYTLLKRNKKAQSIRTVSPLIYEQPGFGSLKDVLSILKG